MLNFPRTSLQPVASTSSSRPLDKKINLSFAWKQETPHYDHSNSRADVVNLMFQNMMIEVKIPEKIQLDEECKLPLTCSCYDQNRNKSEKTVESVTVSFEHFKNLTILIQRYEASHKKVRRMMDSVSNAGKYLGNLSLDLKSPSKLENGKNYKLLVTSDYKLEFSAKLVKEETSDEGLKLEEVTTNEDHAEAINLEEVTTNEDHAEAINLEEETNNDDLELEVNLFEEITSNVDLAETRHYQP